MSSIRLEIGKYYRQRDGKEIGPVIKVDEESYPFEVRGYSGRCWQANGMEFGDLETAGDLVAEVPAPCALKAAVDKMEEAAQAEQKADAAGAGLKFDAGKPPIGLIPASAVIAEAEVLAFGAQKYDAHNWRKGMRWSRLGDAAARHLFAWLDGEDCDPETGLHHLAHLRADAGFLLEYAKTGAGTDDRHKASAQ